ncbi:hypothetical protein MM440_10445 [Arsenicicoccus piscis]|uniref:DUF502 domain-containing protein n=1 Tax=Arsenicicoccus piscis TaxID=673954 RepID=A0ABQ6HL48_9MICO|nr:hypothetical protein [Arsenicicoccus piscis]MCH8628183.1 hypothetical protein [Arsenicicoccus piscis]GMA18419.1 hypothetical protein GCM10025862_04400 [Arsenicicoccus piscis]
MWWRTLWRWRRHVLAAVRWALQSDATESEQSRSERTRRGRLVQGITHGGQAIGSTVAAAPRLAWRWGPRPVNDQIEHLVRRAPVWVGSASHLPSTVYVPDTEPAWTLERTRRSWWGAVLEELRVRLPLVIVVLLWPLIILLRRVGVPGVRWLTDLEPVRATSGVVFPAALLLLIVLITRSSRQLLAWRQALRTGRWQVWQAHRPGGPARGRQGTRTLLELTSISHRTGRGFRAVIVSDRLDPELEAALPGTVWVRPTRDSQGLVVALPDGVAMSGAFLPADRRVLARLLTNADEAQRVGVIGKGVIGTAGRTGEGAPGRPERDEVLARVRRSTRR